MKLLETWCIGDFQKQEHVHCMYGPKIQTFSQQKTRKSFFQARQKKKKKLLSSCEPHHET